MTLEWIDKLESMLSGTAEPVGQAISTACITAYNNPLETAKAVGSAPFTFIYNHPLSSILTIAGSAAAYLAYKKGVFDYLPKPWDWKIANGQLSAKVDTCIGGTSFDVKGWIGKKPGYL